MVESKQTVNNQSENINRTATDKSCMGATTGDRGIGRSSTEETNRPITGESPSSSARSGSQAETQTQNGKMNSALSRALIGGLIGGTLGSLAGALAGRRIGEGFNHTIKGVGEAAKTIGEGLGYTAKGVGEVAKSFAEGASHAVVGGAIDTAQGAAEGVKQTAVSTLDAVQKTAQDVNQAVQDTTEWTKQAADNFQISENGGKQDSQQTQNQDVGRGQRETSTQSIYISTPEYSEGYVGESTTFVNEEVSVASLEDSSLEEEINRIDS